jgi:hypothetical protein
MVVLVVENVTALFAGRWPPNLPNPEALEIKS